MRLYVVVTDGDAVVVQLVPWARPVTGYQKQLPGPEPVIVVDPPGQIVPPPEAVATGIETQTNW
jgi:hypothetical protein